MSTKKTKSQKVVENPVVVKIESAVETLVSAAQSGIDHEHCPDAVVARIQTLVASLQRTAETATKRMASAAVKAEKAKQLEATKEERKAKILERIKKLQAKVDSMD